MTYINKPDVDSILSQCIPSLSSISIRFSYAMIIWVLSHISCGTNPWTTSWLLVMVLAHGTGSCKRGGKFLDASCTPTMIRFTPRASQHNVSVGPIGRPSSTYTNNSLQSFHPYFPYKLMGVGSHMRLFLESVVVFLATSWWGVSKSWGGGVPTSDGYHSGPRLFR